jgi:hypothetical protein
MMTVHAQRNQCGLFLKALFDRKPSGTVVMVMQAPRWSEAKAFLAWPPAVELSFGQPDVYFGCCALRRKPGKGSRGGEAEAAFLPGCWIDVDIDGSPDGHGGGVTGHAPSQHAAIKALGRLAKPTFVISSGYGFQPWYLLDQPFVLTDAGMQRRAKRIVYGLQRRLEHDAGWKVDKTADLARVLRLPGTTNTKGEQPVDVSIVYSGGPHHRLEDLERLGAEFAADADTGDGRKPARPAGDWARLIRDGVDSGERHERIWQLAGYLLRREIDPVVALEIVQAFNLARVRPPYDEANVKRLFDGIVRREVKRRREASAERFHALRGGSPSR